MFSLSFSDSGLSLSLSPTPTATATATAECGWPLPALAKSQVDFQDVPSGIDVAMPVFVMANPFIILVFENVCALPLFTLLNTVRVHALVDLGGEDRFALPMAMAELLARVCLMHHRHSSPVDQRKPLS